MFQLRSEAQYDQQIQILELNPEMATAYGLKYRCPFNVLRNFHCIWRCLSDYAHDLLEGVVPIMISRTLTAMVDSNYLTLLMINAKIRVFDYKLNDKKNKLIPLTMDRKKIVVKQNASQAECLLNLLPLWFGDIIDNNNEKWKLFLDLVNLVNLILIDEATEVMLSIMDNEINDFLSQLKKLYPDSSITPKMHYLCHYARQYVMFGPIRKNGLLKYERQHSALKSSIKNSKNHQQVCLSMAEHHSRLQALHHQRRLYYQKESEFSKILPYHTCISSFKLNNEKLYNNVISNGIRYEVNSAIVMKSEIGGLVNFGYIKACMFYEECDTLIVQKCDTTDFMPENNAFVIIPLTDQEVFIRIQDIILNKCLPVYPYYDHLVVMRTFALEENQYSASD